MKARGAAVGLNNWCRPGPDKQPRRYPTRTVPLPPAGHGQPGTGRLPHEQRERVANKQANGRDPADA
jgi:hypothetical protein